MQKSLSIAGLVLGLVGTLVSVTMTVLQIISLRKSR